jgi:hypothetical protein
MSDKQSRALSDIAFVVAESSEAIQPAASSHSVLPPK